MARLTIDTGIEGNPATGDTLRTAMTKINTNFTEVYSLVRDGSSGLIATDVTNGDLVLQANGTGSIEIDTLSIQNSTITSIGTNSDITITPNGTGNVVLGNFTFNADQTVGASEDNYVFVYDHSTGTIGLEASAAGDVTASSTTTFTNKTFDANGTGNSISNIDIADFTSGVFVDEDNMASNSATAIASQQSIKAYVDAEDANIASDSMTFTNKSGNISQWTNDSNYATQAYVDARDIGDLAITGSTISAPSNADLTLTTSGTGNVVFDSWRFRDNNLEGHRSNEHLKIKTNGTGTLTLESAGSIVLDANVVSLNAGLHVGAGGDQAGGVLIEDNTIKTARSNENIELLPNGTGSVHVQTSLKLATGATVTGILDEDNMSSNSATQLATQQSIKAYVDSEISGVSGSTGDLAITGSTISAPSNADLTLNAGGTGSVDIEGIQIKGTEISSTDSTQVTIKENLHVTGNISGTITGTVTGTIDADNSTISNLEVDNFKASAIVTEGEGIGSNDNDTTIPTSAAVKDYVDSNPTTSLAADNLTIGDAAVSITTTTGDITLDTQESNRDIIFKGTDDGVDITPFQLDMSEGGKAIFQADIQGQGVTISDNTITSNRSNDNLELDAAGTGQVVANAAFKFNAGYVEKINTLTSSSTITVDCSAASIHKVTLATNTEFNISNLPTGGTVTLIITQDGSGSRTATFGTDGSTAVKFPGGAPTLSTGAADIDVVTIVNDGTNFLGNCAKNYS